MRACVGRPAGPAQVKPAQPTASCCQDLEVKMVTRMFSVVLVVLLFQRGLADELWEKDMSEEIYIEGSHEGFEKVTLK